ncbi:helix-turn-helix domain-containing protein [Streptococcus respiraculi]|uniref:helix-turn-helix domain-containing protein n=1 Tax=Streptococcus respiraculi TaxID=2021971 RepID=UPI000E770DF5|nr:helix-turn-helix transcriptional regulator [Streptococcus respiraculi]
MTFLIHNFGKNLSRLRKEKGLTQDELAQSIGVQKAAISKMELGTSYPSFSNLDKIAEFFKATPNQLFGTPRDIEIEKAIYKTDEYDEKAKTILSALKQWEQFEESEAYCDLLWLTRGPELVTKDGDPLYEDFDGRITNSPDYPRGMAYGLSPIEMILKSKVDIEELAKKVQFIEENKELLKK